MFVIISRQIVRRSRRGAWGVLHRTVAIALIYALPVYDVKAADGVSLAAPRSRSLAFDFPAQPLVSALERYSEVTGRNALYDTALASGRISREIRGVFSPDEALKKLLSGTGLSPEFVADTTFVLLPVMVDQRGALPTRSSEDRRYYGEIQAGITNALCGLDRPRPGHYRFTAVLWIAPDGTVRRSVRIGSVGGPDADRQIDATLSNVRFTSPPLAFQQPVLILIVPQGPGVTRDCGSR